MVCRTENGCSHANSGLRMRFTAVVRGYVSVILISGEAMTQAVNSWTHGSDCPGVMGATRPPSTDAPLTAVLHLAHRPQHKPSLDDVHWRGDRRRECPGHRPTPSRLVRLQRAPSPGCPRRLMGDKKDGQVITIERTRHTSSHMLRPEARNISISRVLAQVS